MLREAAVAFEIQVKAHRQECLCHWRRRDRRDVAELGAGGAEVKRAGRMPALQENDVAARDKQ